MLERSKYDVIWNSAPVTTRSGDCEYATFLKDLERVCSTKGYLDSTFYTKHVPSKLSGDEVIKIEGKPILHSYDIARNRESFLEDYERKMKRINMSLLQEKRHERVLKRHEGDIIKRQHLVSQSLRDFEIDVNEKKFEQDLRLNKTAEDLDQIRKRHFYEKSLTTKERMRNAITNHVEKIGKSRQMDLNVSKLLREFNAKKNQLNSNTHDIARLMEEFEDHLFQEENKHKKLQNELNSISEILKQEVMKSKTHQIEMERDGIKQTNLKLKEDKIKESSLEQFLNQSDGGIKDSAMEKKLLDARLLKQKEEHSIKKQENSGALNTIKNKLVESENTQRRLISDNNYIDLMMKRVDQQNNIESANLRRVIQKEKSTNEKIKEREANDEKYDARMFNHQIMMDLANESDNLSHLKTVLKNGKETEQRIFKKMNDASKEIKQESMIVNRLSKELHDFQILNANKINEEMREANKKERKLEEKLNRQQTLLIELQTKRNNYFNELVKCRKFLNDDKYLLQKSEVQTSRLETIKGMADEHQSSLPHIV